jgi:large subunit ribosomal protein L4
MVRLALRSALSDRAAESRIKVVDDWGIDEPRTKRAVEVLESLGLRPAGQRCPRVLLVLDRTEEAAWKSFRNLGDRVRITLPEELNAHDVLLSDWLVFSTGTLRSAVAHFSTGTAGDGADGADGGDVADAGAPAIAAEPAAAAPAPVAAVEADADADSADAESADDTEDEA